MNETNANKSLAFVLLSAAGGFAIFSSTMSKTPVLPLFAESLGATPKIVGFIAAAATVVGIVISAPAGIFSDHVGRRRVLLIAGIVFASAPFLYYWVHTPWQLAILRVYHGFATAIFGPVAMALVADLFSSGRAEKMGTYSSATLVGRFLAPLLGGVLIYRFGFRSVYLFCGVFGVIALVLLFRIPAGQTPAPQKKKVKFSLSKMANEFSHLVRNVPLMVTSMSEAAVYFAFGAVETFFPLYAVKMGIDTRQVGLLFSLQILTIAFTKPLMGKVSDQYGRKSQIIVGLVAGAIAVGSLSFSHHTVSFGLILIFFGLSMATVTASTAALAADLSRQSAFGSSMGMLSSIMDIGHAAGPIVAGFFVTAWGYQTNFLLVSLIMAAPILIVPIFVRMPSPAVDSAS
jgi:MFS family permease